MTKESIFTEKVALKNLVNEKHSIVTEEIKAEVKKRVRGISGKLNLLPLKPFLHRCANRNKIK